MPSSACSVMTRMLPPWRCPPSTISALPFCCSRSFVVANMTFQSVGKAGRATFLACCRQGVFFIPLILILPRTFGLVGVEICQPIADALTFIVSLPFLLAFLKQLDRMDDAEKPKHSPESLS